MFIASAVPGPPVERRTYDTLKAEFLQRLRDLMPLDGVYLPMHGAMYVEGLQDAEGDWISAVDGVTLVLTARRRPFHEIVDFTSLGLDPLSFAIIVVKAGYLVPAIDAIAKPNLMALSDGSVNQDIEHLDSRHRVPTFPFVQNVSYTPTTIVSARAKR